MTYDPFGRLMSRRATAGQTTRYTQDLATPLAQILSDGATNYGYGHERLAAQAGSTTTWYASDALGSVRQTLNASGAVLSTTSYDPWGQVESGSLSTFGFTGERQDAGGLVYLRARWYDPASGMFTTPDPFPGVAHQPYSQHPYQYAYSNPVLHRDPSGRFVPLVAATVVGGLIGAGVEYGGQVYQNYQAGRQGWDAWQPTDGGAIARSAASGALASGASFFVGPAVAGLPWLARFGSPLVRSILAGGIEGITSNTLAQLAMNLALGCDWARGLNSAAFSGLVGGGIGGGIGWLLRRYVVQIVGFSGVGFDSIRNPYSAKYTPDIGDILRGEHPLIKAGHVGVSFNGRRIFGFAPSDAASNEMERLIKAGQVYVFDSRANDFRQASDVLDFLLQGDVMAGQVRDDTWVFSRAAALTLSTGGTTRLKQFTYNVSAEQFYPMRNQVWRDVVAAGRHNPQKWYGFPPFADAPMPSGCNNCATYGRTLGLNLPENTGNLRFYIPMLPEPFIPPWQ